MNANFNEAIQNLQKISRYALFFKVTKHQLNGDEEKYCTCLLQFVSGILEVSEREP